MFDVSIETIETEEGVYIRLSWYDGKEHHEKWIQKSNEELFDDP